MFRKRNYALQFLSSLVLVKQSVAHQDNGAGGCVMVSYWRNSDEDDISPPGCEGEPEAQVAMPVGLEPLEMCTALDMYGTPFSTDVFCHFPQGLYHQNSYFGTKNCEKDDSALTMEQTAKSNQCVNLPGMSVLFKCLSTPCQSNDLGSSEVVSPQDVLDLHRQMFRF